MKRKTLAICLMAVIVTMLGACGKKENVAPATSEVKEETTVDEQPVVQEKPVEDKTAASSDSIIDALKDLEPIKVTEGFQFKSYDPTDGLLKDISLDIEDLEILIPKAFAYEIANTEEHSSITYIANLEDKTSKFTVKMQCLGHRIEDGEDIDEVNGYLIVKDIEQFTGGEIVGANIYINPQEGGQYGVTLSILVKTPEIPERKDEAVEYINTVVEHIEKQLADE